MSQAAEYHGHPMASSLAKAIDAKPIEDYKVAGFSPVPALTYYAEHADGKILHHEMMVDKDGKTIYDQGVPIDYAVGAGVHGRTYLLRRDDRLYESPMSWYSESDEWRFSPGYAVEANHRFDRRVSDGCLGCHAGRVDAINDESHTFAANPFPEESIGCERCHGPGQAHIAFRSASQTDSGNDPICNPSRLSQELRDAVCNQCHLQGRRRVVRYGHTEFDYRPGQHLSDIWVIFLKTQGVEKGVAAAVSQVEQMRSSRCYIESDGKLGCVSCHDAHQVPGPDEKTATFRTRCLECHGDGQKACSETNDRRQVLNDSCVACHMPKKPAADVHAAQTDHRILKRHLEEASQAADGDSQGQSQQMLLFEEKGCDVPAWEIERAKAIFQAERMDDRSNAVAKSVIDMLLANFQQHPDDVESGYALGLAFRAIQQPALAIKTWEKVIAVRPAHEDAIEAIATEAHQQKDLKTAKACYERLIQLTPNRAQCYGRLAHVLGQLGDRENAIAAAKKCLELNPSLPQSHAWLADVYRLSGDAENAAIHKAFAERIKEAPGMQSTKSP